MLTNDEHVDFIKELEAVGSGQPPEPEPEATEQEAPAAEAKAEAQAPAEAEAPRVTKPPERTVPIDRLKEVIAEREQVRAELAAREAKLAEIEAAKATKEPAAPKRDWLDEYLAEGDEADTDSTAKAIQALRGELEAERKLRLDREEAEKNAKALDAVNADIRKAVKEVNETYGKNPFVNEHAIWTAIQTDPNTGRMSTYEIAAAIHRQSQEFLASEGAVSFLQGLGYTKAQVQAIQADQAEKAAPSGAPPAMGTAKSKVQDDDDSDIKEFEDIRHSFARALSRQ